MPPDPGGARAGSPDAFEVTLSNFTGPFDLLLSLITKHRLDITEIALAEVTDEFLAHMAALDEWDLSRASEFLVVAATLLDLKAARLLPRGDVESEEDLELLEARDLLFARLLAYRAFRQVADHLAALGREAAQRFPRSVPLEPHFAACSRNSCCRSARRVLPPSRRARSSPGPSPPGWNSATCTIPWSRCGSRRT